MAGAEASAAALVVEGSAAVADDAMGDGAAAVVRADHRKAGRAEAILADRVAAAALADRARMARRLMGCRSSTGEAPRPNSGEPKFGTEQTGKRAR